MDRRIQRWCAWGAPISIVAFVLGWAALAGFLPPLPPGAGAAGAAGVFAARPDGIRLGAIVMIIGTLFWIPWAAVVAAKADRPGRSRPELVHTQVGCAVVGTVLVVVAMLIWVVAAFRPGRSAEIVQTLSDLGFVIAIMPFAVFCVWNLALGLAIFADDRDEPAYPRWAGYLCVWTAVLYLPGGCLAFFHTGPLAWNGIFAFYVPAAAFFAWLIVLTVLTLKAIDRQGPAAPSPAGAPTSPAGLTHG